MEIYRRAGVLLHANELWDGQWQGEPRSSAVIETEQARPMTLAERQGHPERFDRLAALMARPRRQASADELRYVDHLRQRAEHELVPQVFRELPAKTETQRHPELAPVYECPRACKPQAAKMSANVQVQAQSAS